MKIIFQTGQRVRISEDAFPGSPDQRDIQARGQYGVLEYVLDDTTDETLWDCRMTDGSRVCPIDSELEF